MLPKSKTYELLQYLASAQVSEQKLFRIPPLKSLSSELSMNVSRLREQLEVARALGLVDVSPRTGIRRRVYSFFPAVQQSLSYAIDLDLSYFEQYAELRNHLEEAYWFEAVALLNEEDHTELCKLIERAWAKLNNEQIQIPHVEHRELHLAIYKRLDNAFVKGIFEAYWDAYEAVGLNQYAGYDYLQEVWSYHQRMVDAICSHEFSQGFQALVEHKGLLYHRTGLPNSRTDNTKHDGQ